MRKTTFIIILLLGLFKLGSAQLTPVAEFTFDETLQDSYSNLVLDTSFCLYNYAQDEQQIDQKAVAITGGEFLLHDPAFTRFDSSDFSISFWFKRTASLWPTEYILTKSSGGSYYRFRYNGFFDQMTFYFRPLADSAEINVSTPSASIDTVWHLITCTLDRDDEMKMYLDDQMVFSRSIAHYVGSSADLAGGDFHFGTADAVFNDLRFFKKALDSTEVRALYTHSIALSESKKNLFSLFPNPTERYIQIIGNGLDKKPYQLFATNGQMIQEGIVENNYIDIAALNKGTYQLLIEGYSWSVIKQ
jgi:hypothetical protein